MSNIFCYFVKENLLFLASLGTRDLVFAEITLSRLLVVAGFVTDNFKLKNKYDAKRKYD